VSFVPPLQQHKCNTVFVEDEEEVDVVVEKAHSVEEVDCLVAGADFRRVNLHFRHEPLRQIMQYSNEMHKMVGCYFVSFNNHIRFRAFLQQFDLLY